MTDYGGRPYRPVLSLSLPVYNSERYLAETLDNVLESEFTDWHLLICDNASTDGTDVVAKQYCAKDPRISYMRHDENIGAARNHNAGVAAATGEFHAWVQWDNLYDRSYFRRCIEALRAEPHYSCVYGSVQDIDGDGTRLQVWREDLRDGDSDVVVRFRDLTENDHMVFQFFGVVRTDVLRRTSMHASFDSADRLFAVQLALQGPIKRLDDVLFFHREHPHRMMNNAPSARSVYPVLDPVWIGRVPFPVLNIGRQYVVAALHAPIGPRDKLRCALAMRGWLRTNWLRCVKTVGRGLIEYVKLWTVERSR